MTPLGVDKLVDRIASNATLDKVARPLSKKIAALVPAGAAPKDFLSGTWLGHPLHPMLTDLPIGFWTNAVVLDLLGGKRGRDAARRLVGLGVLSALPTAASGLADWSDTLGEERRIGLIHAAGNVAAVSCYALSWCARRRGDHRKGVLLGLLGGTVATASAYLGGHLAWRRGVNVNRHAWAHDGHDWVDVGEESLLASGEPSVVDAAGEPVVLISTGGAVYALAEVCSHAGGPLHEGAVADGCVVCPWHGSAFRLDDGSVVHGPATSPQPHYEVRVETGRISVRRA